MKISISFPPLISPKGTPTLSQNRQFQWFSSPTYIYPVVPASAATLLKKNDYEIFWDDGIAEELTYDGWLKRIKQEKPDIIVIETKTPVIKKHWQIIKDVKCQMSNVKCILMGDHVTAMPEESFKNCSVDYALTGGDYDFMLLNLANHLTKGEKLEPGWYYRQDTRNKMQETKNIQIFNTGKFKLNHDLNLLPIIDRKLTKWKLYAYKNGNFKYTPGSYIMSSRDCWHAACTFCSWTTLFPAGCYRIINSKKILDEIGELIKLGIKEVMEDSGTLPTGQWLKDFCHGMIEKGYNKKIKISCNMRINAIKNPEIWKLMKQAGFRMILFGLESANQKILDKINKNLKTEEIEPCLKMCKKAGLEPHITIMLGHPQETKQGALETLNLAKKLFQKGFVDSIQATIMIPYPGTPLYKYCQENNLLLTKDYDNFDQRQQVMKSEITEEDIKKMTRQLYKSFLTPKFFWNKIKSIKSLDDVKFYFKALKKVGGHLSDFSK